MDNLFHFLLYIFIGGTILFLCPLFFILNAHKKEIWEEIKRRL